MSICASGASTTKPGVASSVVVDQVYIESLLPADWSWLFTFLGYTRALQIGNVGAFCALDPPAWTLPSAADFYTFITGGYLSDSDTVTQFIAKLTQSYLWYSLCQCTSGSTPAAPSASSPPSGLTSVNPTGVVAPPAGGGCATYTGGPITPDSGGNHDSMIGTVNPSTGVIVTAVPIPSGATKAVISYVCAGPGGGGTSAMVIDALTWDTAHANSSLDSSPNFFAPGTATHTVTVPATAVGLMVRGGQLDLSVTNNRTLSCTVVFYCNGALPGQSESPCCPPDPIALGMMTQILSMVTLVQRQLAPFAYVMGAAHAGLSGSGTFSVQGILGLKIALTTAPSRLGDVSGDPVTIWDAGWINTGTTDGFGPRIFISSNPMVVQPISSDVTVIGYSIPADVVCTITELVREP